MSIKNIVFSSSCVQDFLKGFIEFKKHGLVKMTQADLAKIMNVRPPYLTKVLGGQANLSEDQLFLLLEHLELDSELKVFLNLLLARDRTTVQAREKQLTEKIDAMRTEKLATEASILTSARANIEEYYLNPLNLIAHISISVDGSGGLFTEIANGMGMKRDEQEEIIQTLERLNIIENLGDHYRVLETDLHLSSKSTVFKAYQILMRQLVTERMRRKREDDYNLSISFSSNEVTVATIRAKFLNFLKEVDQLIEDGREEGVYQFNVDLFSWS